MNFNFISVDMKVDFFVKIWLLFIWDIWSLWSSNWHYLCFSYGLPCLALFPLFSLKLGHLLFMDDFTDISFRSKPDVWVTH